MKEFIEIPFGAKDSELCGWEYTIPKGYTASIENGKIIVTKEESEDEKIRKYLLKLAERCPDDSIDFMHEVKKEDVVAWLEKQEEQKTTWSEEDEEMLSRIDDSLKALRFMYINGGEEDRETWKAIDEEIKYIKSLKDRVQPQQEWSKDDEEMLKDIKSNFEFNKSGMTEGLIEQYNHFFDKIKYLQPQPKQN